MDFKAIIKDSGVFNAPVDAVILSIALLCKILSSDTIQLGVYRFYLNLMADPQNWHFIYVNPFKRHKIDNLCYGVFP
jgi:hypothetical protein